MKKGSINILRSLFMGTAFFFHFTVIKSSVPCFKVLESLNKCHQSVNNIILLVDGEK